MPEAGMDNEYPQYEDEESYEPEPPLPLYAAASSGDHTELERLLKISTDMVNRRDKYDKFNQRDYNYCLEDAPNTALEIAIIQNDIESVRLLLDHGADPELWLPWSEQNVRNNATSVCEAAALGHLDILRLLIEKGGLVTSIVLYSAVDCGRLECVKELFAWLAINKRNEFDDGVAMSTAVAWALRTAAGGWRDDIVEFLITNGHADKKSVDCALMETLILQDDWLRRNCVREGPSEEARKKRIEVVKLLLEAGADVDPGYEEKDIKPLHRVAREGNQAREIFDLLLDRNVDVNSVNYEGTKYENGQTPLFQAVLADDIYFVERLLEKGASVTHIDKSGNTLLHASTSNHTSACSVIMQLLLHHGLSTCAINSNGRTALHEASSQGNVEALKLLLALNHDLIACKTPEGWTALHSAVDPFLHWKVDIAVVLLANGADINAITKDGRTVLQLAIVRNHYDSIPFISYLLENGADITAIYNEGTVDDSDPISKDPASMALQEARVVRQVGDSLLHLAVDTQHISSGSMSTLRLLLDRGIDLESRDIQGRTPVLRAADYGREFRYQYVMELINRGADINVKDDGGLGLEDRVKNKGYTITKENGKVVGFKRIPGTEPEIRSMGGRGRGWGRGRGRTVPTDKAVEGGLAGPKEQGKGHGYDLQGSQS